MLPKGMTEEERCNLCHEKMELTHSFLQESGKGVEVWWKCPCGNIQGFIFTDRWVEAYKNANKPKEPVLPGDELDMADPEDVEEL